MKIINLTMHDVNICDDNDDIIRTYTPSGMVARVRHGWDVVEYVDEVPMMVRKNERLVDLPEPKEGTMYIVSNIILDYCPDRRDLLAPGQQVKKYGRVIGCKAFICNR